MTYTQRLAEANLVPSVGSVGDSYDNALAETINGLYKAEVIWRQRSWPSASAVEMATLRWVDWFNSHRLFGPIGYIPPAEAEANCYAALENLDIAASSKPNCLWKNWDASNHKKSRPTASCAWQRHYASPHNVQSRAQNASHNSTTLRGIVPKI